MEKLSETEQKELSKNSTERLRQLLLNGNIRTAEEIANMDRPTMLQVMAEHRVAETAATASSVRLETAFDELERWKVEMMFREKEMMAKLELERERLRFEMESRERDRQLEFESRERDRQLELECRERERKAERDQQEAHWLAEMERRDQWEKHRQEDDHSLANQIKKYSDIMKNVFPSMPFESAELPNYLDEIDSLFQSYEVPDNIRGKLFVAHLPNKVKYVISQLTTDKRNDYEELKSFLLKEFKVTARDLRSRFLNASKKPNESYNVFRGRLFVLMSQYLQARQADTMEKLIDLLIADKLKDCLPKECLKHVLGIEGSQCFDAYTIAEHVDVRFILFKL